MALNYFNIASAIPSAQGLWILASGEPLLMHKTLDRFKAHWHKAGIERHRIDASKAGDWDKARNHLTTLSLFAEQCVVEVHLEQLPDAKSLQWLNSFASNPSGQLLLCCLSKVEKKQLTHAIYKLADSKGQAIALTLNTNGELKSFLQQEAKDLQLTLSDEAWQLLLSYTHNNTLAAHQAIVSLGYVHNGSMVEASTLTQFLAQSSKYTTFELSDYLLAGKAAKALEVLHYLKQIDEKPSSILWVIARDLKVIAQIVQSPGQAESICQEHGIWRNKTSLYASAARRHNIHSSNKWPRLMLQVDQSIKGAFAQNPWLLLEQAIVSACGLANLA